MKIYFEKIQNANSFWRTLAFIVIPSLIAPVVLGLILSKVAPTNFWEIKFIDIFNLLAQLATAGALVLGIHQYRKNKKLERQLTLVAECRSLIERMNVIAREHSKYESLTAAQTKQMINALVGVGENFDAIFLSLDEDINKAIVRMHWQDFYFGALTESMNKIDSHDFLFGIGVGAAQIIKSLQVAKKNGVDDESDYSFRAYYMAVGDDIDNIQLSAADKVEMFNFEKAFFSNEALKDHLYGTMNIIDPRFRIPVVHAVNAHVNKALYRD